MVWSDPESESQTESETELQAMKGGKVMEKWFVVNRVKLLLMLLLQ
jgi:hypothetical protein